MEKIDWERIKEAFTLVVDSIRNVLEAFKQFIIDNWPLIKKIHSMKVYQERKQRNWTPTVKVYRNQVINNKPLRAVARSEC